MADTSVVVVTCKHEGLIPFCRRADSSHLIRINGREIEGVDERADETTFGGSIPDDVCGEALSVEG
jgi:hypothetical protein